MLKNSFTEKSGIIKQRKMRKLKSQRVIIKIGTNVLTDSSGFLEKNIIRNIARQVSEIRSKTKRDIIIVTSGAIGAGMAELGLKSRPDNIVMRQACASVGQSILMDKYYREFSLHKIKIAQILLSYGTLNEQKTLMNMKENINRLFELGVIPIVNENDAISTEEIGKSFGDNDIISALLAVKINADLLMLLTNVDGVYNSNPLSKNSELIKEIHELSDKAIDTTGKSNLGVGGMKTKIEAAKMAVENGVSVIIANGKSEKIILKIINGEDVGTLFAV